MNLQRDVWETGAFHFLNAIADPGLYTCKLSSSPMRACSDTS
jgi:hypothetical protein